jgi:hypothetical protein
LLKLLEAILLSEEFIKRRFGITQIAHFSYRSNKFPNPLFRCQKLFDNPEEVSGQKPVLAKG